MTVQNIPSTKEFTGSGTTGPFSFSFVFYDDTEISVRTVDLSSNVVVLTQGVDYTVAGAGIQAGGSVNLTSALAAGWTLIVARTLPIEQDLELPNQSAFSGPAIEDALDHVTMICQQLEAQLGEAGAGIPGPQGVVGSQGTQGVQGVQGNQGNPGNQGAQGQTGSQGNQGTQGNIGTQGNQGSPSTVAGPQGVQGPQGNQGAVGSQGNPGIGLNFRGEWVSGTTYAIADATVYGAASYVCYLGTSGTSNPSADTTHWVLLGATGAQGSQGNQGAQGVQGSQGNQGSQGSTGSGSQGVQGSQGLVGPQGNQGSQGSLGNQGYQGTTGAQGGSGYEVDALVTYGGGTSYTNATIASALAAIGTMNKATLLLRPGTWVISSSVDWSAYTNVTFKLPPGAVLSHGAFTVNIPNLEAGLYQVFSGAGAVTLSGSTRVVHPEWWADNTTPGTTDMQSACYSAITAAPNESKVILGNYALSSTLIIDRSYIVVESGMLTGDLTVSPVLQIGTSVIQVYDVGLKNLKVTRAAGSVSTAYIGVLWENYNYGYQENIEIYRHGIGEKNTHPNSLSLAFESRNLTIHNCSYAYLNMDNSSDSQFLGGEFGRNGGETVGPGAFCIVFTGLSEAFHMSNFTIVPRHASSGTTTNAVGFIGQTDLNGIYVFRDCNVENVVGGIISDPSCTRVIDLQILGGRWAIGNASNMFGFNSATWVWRLKVQGASVTGCISIPPHANGMEALIENNYLDGPTSAFDGGGGTGVLTISGNHFSATLSLTGVWNKLVYIGNSWTAGGLSSGGATGATYGAGNL